MFNQDMHLNSVERLTLEVDLRQAVQRGQLTLDYQPIIKMPTDELTGFEALVRWQHPVRGLIAPVNFIPIAEETGIIVPLGHWVLEQACRQLASWHAAYPSMANLSVSVNLSRKQIAEPDLAERVERVLRETGIEAANLKLEITESAIMDDVATAVRVFTQIQKLGVCLHMDDFGTGYSSLSCLQQFPLDGLKIDRDLVRRATGRPEDAAVVRAINSLAQSLNIPLVAEGIENAEQLTLLQSLGCGYLQGFLYAKPMDESSATAYISQNTTTAAAA